MQGADVLISLSTLGPDSVKKEWISKMVDISVVFVCANPLPDIYLYAKLIVYWGFSGTLKGALTVRAQKMTDSRAIVAVHSLANCAVKVGKSREYYPSHG